ncbi:hypothetical protein ACETAC_01835 [Aceticella autotrophica]|uniref:Uncharacterized protein n=1 Tax=Aceticella autotrophica TaxID=2755338 RepID=A0A975GAN9_9THEO|nr:hypothetical protein [Aceticella autotrophica]QSZ27669.1 hypothetical protein ACETAC_01835 [Aceticella autotrophica]
MSRKNIFIIWGSVAALLIICYCVLIFIILPRGFIEMEKEGYGHIKLPNKYEIGRISATYRVLSRNETGSGGEIIKDSKTGEYIDFDINAIAWNDRYVFFHINNKAVSRVDSKGHDYEVMPGPKRFGILDTKTGEVNTYLTLEEAQQALVELGAGTLKLKSVEDFFPETSGETHPFELN